MQITELKLILVAFLNQKWEHIRLHLQTRSQIHLAELLVRLAQLHSTYLFLIHVTLRQLYLQQFHLH